MTILTTGTSRNYADNWEQAFGSRKKQSAKKKTASSKKKGASAKKKISAKKKSKKR
jgi:hypothetical protein